MNGCGYQIYCDQPYLFYQSKAKILANDAKRI